MLQLRDFIKRNVPGSYVTIEQDGRFCRIHIYSYTARMLAELLYSNSQVALDRKFVKARRMFSCAQRAREFKEKYWKVCSICFEEFNTDYEVILHKSKEHSI